MNEERKDELRIWALVAGALILIGISAALSGCTRSRPRPATPPAEVVEVPGEFKAPEPEPVQEFAIDPAGRVVVEFAEDGCEACAAMKPIVDKLKADGCKLYAINISRSERNRELAHERQVKGYPTFVVYREGKEVERHVGGASDDAIRQWLAE